MLLADSQPLLLPLRSWAPYTTLEGSFVPKLDFLVIGDHVRPESGVFNILAAGVDRVATEVPGLLHLGVAGRVVFNDDELMNPHLVDIRITGPNHSPVLQIRGEIVPAASTADLPDDWPQQGGLAVNMTVPIQEHGVTCSPCSSTRRS